MSERIIKDKIKKRTRIKRQIKKKIEAVDSKPRISVFKSSKHTYAQAISDQSGKTLISASTMEKEVAQRVAKTAPSEKLTSKAVSLKSQHAARVVGMVLAERLKAAGLTSAVFDRNGFKYHGRVQALADGIREAGFKL